MTVEEDVDVTVGEEFTVTLDAMTGGGYVWTEEHDASKVELVERQDQVPAAPGAVRVSVFRYRALAAGEAAVRLRYQRPWEKQPVRTQTYRVVDHR